jgi:hypothetical protein
MCLAFAALSVCRMVNKSLALVVAGAVTLSLSSCVQFVEHSFSDDHTVDSGVSSVRMQNGSGDVKVRYREGGATTIHRVVVHRRDEKPSGDTHRVEGDVLVLGGCGDNCSVNYEVWVPSANVRVLGEVGSGDVEVAGVASVEVNAGSGNVVVRDIAGPVRVETGSGDVRINDVAGDVTSKAGSGGIRLDGVKGSVVVDSGSGDIDGKRMSGGVTADTGSGGVRLELVSPQSVRAHSGSGDVTVRVPAGPYRVDAVAGHGTRDVGVTDDSKAEHELWVRADTGDVSVRAA